jgi:hypothetical protein
MNGITLGGSGSSIDYNYSTLDFADLIKYLAE